ncbi:MAG: alpha-1,2-fucosyltransferase [Nanoarchaeota archaeon]|nr:alpha-1,2-fucosyltransferase [Nanoarchaeota archaeon]
MKDIHYYSGRMGNEMFRDAYIYTQRRKDNIPDVYLQDEKYFKEFAEEIKERYNDGIGFIPRVGIHVRRGGNPTNPDEPNYSDNPFYVNLAEGNYYERAMELFPNGKFIIFSDDTGYCKKRFPDIKVIEGGTELEDFNQLASCEHQIIANSSFSWWAGYLNPNPSKKVVAPKAWFADGDNSRIGIPKSWIQI